jgi:hypothetical protein
MDTVGCSAAQAGTKLATANIVKIVAAGMAALLRPLFAEARSAKAERNLLLFAKITLTSFLGLSKTCLLARDNGPRVRKRGPRSGPGR